MQTYIIKSQGHYKIGRTIDINKRLQAFRTTCFRFDVIRVFNGDFEACLHSIFHKKRIRHEWFKLSNKDLLKADKLISVPFIAERTALKRFLKTRALSPYAINKILLAVSATDYYYRLIEGGIVIKERLPYRGKVTQLTLLSNIKTPENATY